MHVRAEISRDPQGPLACLSEKNKHIFCTDFTFQNFQNSIQGFTFWYDKRQNNFSTRSNINVNRTLLSFADVLRFRSFTVLTPFPFTLFHPL